MFATIRRYSVKPGSLKDIAQKVQSQLVRELARQPGFISYHAIDAGNNVAISVSLYQDRASADAANKAVAQWVQQQIMPLSGPATDVAIGEVVASSAMRA